MSVSVNRERFEQLMMAAVDGELSTLEQREFEAMIAANDSLRKEFDEYKKLKEVTSTMHFASPTNEVWDQYWLDIYSRIERGLAWFLFTVGSAILLTYVSYKLIEAILQNQALAWTARIGILGLLAGIALLFVSVIREKWYVRKKDPYKEIQR
jgi:anti-sigma factor RsiW